MKNPTTKILDKAVVLRLEGKGWDEVTKSTGLNMSQAMRAEMRFKMLLSIKGVPGFEAWAPIPVPGKADKLKTGEIIAEARKGDISWGVLAERAEISEAFCRSAYKLATGVKSEGQRIGKGGRFLDTHEAGHRYYEPGDNRKAGLLIPADVDQRGVELTQAGTIKGISPEKRAILMAAGAAKYAAKKAKAKAEASA